MNVFDARARKRCAQLVFSTTLPFSVPYPGYSFSVHLFFLRPSVLDLHSSYLPRSTGSEARVLFALVLLAALLCFAQPAPAWAQREPAHRARAFADALERFEDRQYALAADAFATYRSAYPNALNAPEALYYEATAQLAQGNDDEAVRLFERLQTDYPTHPRAAEAQLSLGRYFFERGNYAQARTALRRAYETGPTSSQAPRALYGAGEAALEEGDTEAAMDHFRRVADVYPEADVAPNALYALASAQVAREDYDEAARSLETLSARYPEAPYARTLGLALAEVYYELEDYRRTIREVNARISSLQGEERARAAFLRADAHGQLGEDEEAARAYRAFLDDYPGSSYARPARYGLAWSNYRQGNYAQAADAFAQVQQSESSLGGDRSEDDLAEQATYYEAASRSLAGDEKAAAEGYAAFLAAYPGSPRAAEAQYELGILYYGQQRYEDAASAFSQLLENDLDPDTRGNALYWRGNALLALGDLDGALESYDRAIETGRVPASVKEEAAFQRAYALYQDGEYDEAAAAFAAFRRAFPESQQAGDALFWNAESHFQAENFDRAEAGFTQYTNAYAGGPHMNAARYALGWTYFRQQRYEAASATFERFLSTYPRDTGDVPYREDAQLRLADSYYALKRYEDAIRAYGQISGDNEDYALYQQAQAQSFSGALGEAASTLQRLLDDFPESDLREEAQYRLGYVYFQQQDYDAAARAYGRVIDTAPDDPLAAQAQYGIGDALFNDGRFEDAARAYRTVLERYPDAPAASDAAASIQYAFEAMGDDAGATAMIDSFATANPESGAADELRFRRAEAKYRSGDVDGAQADFRRFVRTSQSEDLLPEAYFYLGSISADRGQTAEAENYLRQVVDTYPESTRATSAASRLGRLYREQDRPQEALRLYRTMADLQPDDASVQAEARFGQSMALMSLGQEQEAQQLLQETIDAAPDAPEATLARLGLARLYEEAGRSGEAADLYRRVVRASRDEAGAEALYRLGALRLRQDDPSAALEELSRLPDLYRAYPEWLARGYLVQARAYRRLGQRGDAGRLYDRVLRDFAGTPFAQTAEEEKAAL